MSRPGSDEKYLELKVGGMIIVALALLVTFVLVLGDWSFASKKQLDVYFQNPGGLSPGAAVKIAGRKAGKITEMTYLGQSGPENPATKEPALVRARISIDEDVYQSLRSDVRFYVTTKGVLGDAFLEIAPGTSPRELEKGAKLFGVDPPRLDLFLADAYKLLRGLTSMLERNSENIDQLLGSSARLLTAAEELVSDENTGQIKRLDRIVDGVEGLVGETRELVVSAKEKYVDDPSVSRTIANLEKISKKVDDELGPLIRDVKKALEVVDRLGDTIGPEETKRIKSALAKLETIANRTDKTLADVGEVVTKIKTGQGTVGQLLRDDEIYDDLKEFIRDLKRNPWKLIWQE